MTTQGGRSPAEDAVNATVSQRAPSSLLAALLLDRVLLPRLDSAARQALKHRTVEVEMSDSGLRVRLQLGERGFLRAPGLAGALGHHD